MTRGGKYMLNSMVNSKNPDHRQHDSLPRLKGSSALAAVECSDILCTLVTSSFFEQVMGSRGIPKPFDSMS